MWKANVFLLVCVIASPSLADPQLAVICPPSAGYQEKLAAKEIRRYVYLRTGELPKIGQAVKGDAIVVATKERPIVNQLADAPLKTVVDKLEPQQYMLKTLPGTNHRVVLIVGGDDLGTLYGVYRFVENLGVRFYLHGDVIPDRRLSIDPGEPNEPRATNGSPAFADSRSAQKRLSCRATMNRIPDMNETGRPLFELRGVNPWGSHPFGFDAWGADDYKAVFTQLAKLRMNFLGVHCYPESHPYAEPTVWHGMPSDFDEQGNVRSSYVSRYCNTLQGNAWCMRPGKTCDFSFGGSLLFEDDAWAPDVMRGHCPLPQTPEACNDVFNRTGKQFRDAFSFARELGVKTCIGTESPLTLPKVLQERLQAAGKDPADPVTVRQVYEGTFKRIMAAHPLDYYWIWTPESWTWRGNKPEQYAATVRDLKLAYEAKNRVDAPFQLATAGWVLGPGHDRAALDNHLPKDISVSAISRNTGATEVDPAFERIAGREKWAIPWLESDNREGLAAPQLFVGRMRRDAADALAYRCTGLMGLQWRTQILGPNVSALAAAAWDQTGWNPSFGGPETVEPTDGPLGGAVAAYPGRKISGTEDAVLYQTCRYNFDGYNLKVPNGRYRVKLGFCEPHFNKATERIGDFKLQGKTAVQELDIFGRVGKFTALDLVSDGVDVTDGWLRLRIYARKSWPCISTVVIEGDGFARKINCGGPAYKDYETDLQVTTNNDFLPTDDFYADWATANFGLAEIGDVFAAIDGKVPQVTDGGCPSGKLTPVAKPWSDVAPQFAFVDELESFRPRVQGAGNLDRFDYWLNTFKYCRALAHLRCALAKPDADKIPRLYADAYRYLLATVNTPGGLATVVNMETHPGWGASVAKHTDQPWPTEYQGKPRLIVPTVRTLLGKDEDLQFKVIVLDSQPPKSVMFHWRPLGTGSFRTIPLQHAARAVYQIELPSPGEDFEYRVEATTADGVKLTWPAYAPEFNQTVVTMP